MLIGQPQGIADHELGDRQVNGVVVQARLPAARPRRELEDECGDAFARTLAAKTGHVVVGTHFTVGDPLHNLHGQDRTGRQQAAELIVRQGSDIAVGHRFHAIRIGSPGAKSEKSTGEDEVENLPFAISKCLVAESPSGQENGNCFAVLRLSLRQDKFYFCSIGFASLYE